MRKVGHFVIDLTYLKNTNYVEKVTAKPDEAGEDHYAIKYIIELEVMQKNLYWYAHLLNDNVALPGSQGQVSMVASFHPGVN
jgi:hypothetical protein